MTALYIILGIFAYLAIGGFFAGLFDELYFDVFFWYVAWPAVLLVLLILVAIILPFKNLGYWIRDKIRSTQNRKKK